jgi:hypothetical protein
MARSIGISNTKSLLYRASIDDNFISENGIVAVLGDENQSVKGGIRRINAPSFSRGADGPNPGQ